MSKQTTPIQAIKIALAYATFKDDELASRVTGLLNSLDDDFESLLSSLNAEDYSEDTKISLRSVTERLLEILDTRDTKDENTDEI